MPSTLRRTKRRRAKKACSTCSKRKLACDVDSVGLPCTRCRHDRFDCAIKERKSHPRGISQGNDSPSMRLTTSGVRLSKSRSIEEQSPPRSQCEYQMHNTTLSVSSTSPRTLPEHVISHQIPHWPLLVHLSRSHASGEVDALRTEHILHLENNGAATYSTSTDEINNFMFLKQKRVFDLPDRASMDSVVSAYFEVIHPFFPIIDKVLFRQLYHDCTIDKLISGSGLSLLLLHAVLFSGISVVSADVVSNIGYSARLEARNELYKRTRYLYDFDYEKDEVAVIQSLLLLSHFYPSMTEQKHTWFWVHQAISLAQGAGLHRFPGHDAPQRAIWSRIYWGCLVRDRLVSLGTGRPMHINSLDSDIPMLVSEDLDEAGDDKADRTVKMIFIEFAKLCQYMEGVLSLQHTPPAAETSRPEQVRICEETLQRWLDNLVTEAKRMEEDASSEYRMAIVLLYRTVLHLIYNTVLIALYQPHHSIMTFSRRSDQVQILQKVQNAAVNSTNLATQLVSFGLVKYCPTICVTSMLPVLIVHLLQMRSSRSSEARNLHLNRYSLCMMFLRGLGNIYSHATFYHEFFELAASANNMTLESSALEHDPLIEFLEQRTTTRNDYTQGTITPYGKGGRRTIFPQNQAQDLRNGSRPKSADAMKTPVDAQRSHGVRSTRDATNNLEIDYNSESSAALIEHASPSQALNAPNEFDVRFEEWLAGYDNFQNLFPSA